MHGELELFEDRPGHGDSRPARRGPARERGSAGRRHDPDGFDDLRDHDDLGGYGSPSVHRDPSGYAVSRDHRAAGDFDEPGGYRASGGHDEPGGYRASGGYDEPGGYPASGGHDEPGGYRGSGSYRDPGGYDDEPGYRGEGGYDEPGYREPGRYDEPAGPGGAAGYGDSGRYRGAREIAGPSEHRGPVGADDPADQGPRARRRAAIESRRRRNRTVVLAALGLVVVLAGVDLARGSDGLLLDGPAAAPAASAGADASGAPAASGEPQPESTSALPAGTGTFGYAAGTGKAVGAAGTVQRYRVAVEKGSGQEIAAFTAEVERILAEPRGWTAGGKHRFQRVAEKGQHEFTVYLATPGTSAKMCAAGGMHTDGFTSCRLPGQLILNLDRWLKAVPDYGAPLPDYQAYALNHELGHQLGYGHEACPAPGQPAPVMQQQSTGRKGCTPNPWPFPQAPATPTLYRGPAIP